MQDADTLLNRQFLIVYVVSKHGGHKHRYGLVGCEDPYSEMIAHI